MLHAHNSVHLSMLHTYNSVYYTYHTYNSVYYSMLHIYNSVYHTYNTYKYIKVLLVPTSHLWWIFNDSKLAELQIFVFFNTIKV